MEVKAYKNILQLLKCLVWTVKTGMAFLIFVIMLIVEEKIGLA